MKILVRGDCCSQRTIRFNPDLFGGNPTVVQDEKMPVRVALERLHGVLPNVEVALRYIDQEAMDERDRFYFLSQFGMETLAPGRPDLIMMDCYADMNFELWRHRSGGWHMWTARRYVLDWADFNNDFEFVGQTTLEAAAADTAELIAHYRQGDDSIPVVYLAQPIAFHPRLEDRKEFLQLGLLLRERIPNLFFGGELMPEELDPADLDEVGQTLHFTGETYRRMIENAAAEGLRLPDANSEFLDPFGYASLDDVPLAKVTVPRSDACREYCRIWAGRVPESFREYLSFTPVSSGYEPRCVPMMIDLATYPNWPSFEAYIEGLGKGQQPHMAQRAERNGFYVKRFHWGLFIPDICEINTSEDTRSGGEMSASYRRMVEGMGGPPTAYREPAEPQCPMIWDQQFGVFHAEPGHQQGDVRVDERLVGYAALRRFGNFTAYSMIRGHSDYLPEGVMALLHQQIVRWLIEQRSEPVMAGVRYLFYGGMQNGTAELFQWKRLAGFRPYRVYCDFSGCPQTQDTEAADDSRGRPEFVDPEFVDSEPTFRGWCWRIVTWMRSSLESR